MNKQVTIFGRTIIVNIEVIRSNNAVFHTLATLLLKRKKVEAVKHMRTAFHITLKDCKKIANQVCQAKHTEKDGYIYEYAITNKKEIIEYLNNTLGKYERRNNNG